MNLFLQLLGDAWITVAAGLLAGVLIAIIGQQRDDDYSCAPFEDGEEEDDTAAWDRGHDQWVDRESGVTW